MSKLAVTIDGFLYEVELTLSPQCSGICSATVNGETLPIIVPDLDALPADMEWIVVDERPYELTFDESLSWIKAWSGLHKIEIQDMEAAVSRPRSGDGRIKAPIPGLITRVLVEPGTAVQADQPVLVLEAMKMENEIRAPFEGVVQSISVTTGQSVVRNEVVAEIK